MESSFHTQPNDLLRELENLSKTTLNDRLGVREAGRQLERLLLVETVDALPELCTETCAGLQALYEQYETDLEEDFALRIIEGDAIVVEYPLYDRFNRLVKSECKLAEILPSDKLLFVGSGPFPISPILFSTISGAQVDCFDSSPEACSISRKVIDKLNLSDRVRVIQKSAQDVDLPTVMTPGDYGKYDVVVVALLAQPKAAILDQIWRSVGPYPRVVLRYSEGSRELLYKGMDLSSAIYGNRFVLGEAHHAGTSDTISSIVCQTGSQPHIFKI